MRAPLSSPLVCSLLLAFSLPTAMAQHRGGPPPAPLPSGAKVLEKARLTNERQHRQQFVGQLRTSTSRQKLVVPFVLTMGGGQMVYEFTSGTPEALILHLGENGSRLERATGKGKARTISAGRMDEPVRGTDITYEDMAMRFLYWRQARVIKEDTAMTRSCWVVEAFPDRKGESQYDRVLIWVEKSGALLKVEAFSRGKRAARFEVRKVQRGAHGGYVLKSMTISRMDPATGRDRTPTYLELTPMGG